MISIACQIYSSKKWALSFPYNGVVTINNDAKELTNSSLFDDFLKFSLQNSVISTVHAPLKVRICLTIVLVLPVFHKLSVS